MRGVQVRRTFGCSGLLGGLILVGLVAWPSASAAGQDLPTVPPSDYGRWERLGGSVLSPDGSWIAYQVTRVDETSELRLADVGADSTRVVPWGSSPAFSRDGRWVAWTRNVPVDERKRLQEADEPVRNGVGLLDLRTGELHEFDAVSRHAFDPSGGHLAMLGYAPDEPAGKGANLRVVDVSTGAETTFGNVDSFAWSDHLALLAMAIATGADEGNGVQLFDARSSQLRTLDGSASAYRQLSWREDAADLAVLRSRDPATGQDGTAHDVLAWRGVGGGSGSLVVLGDPVEGIADTLEIVRHRAPEWSSDGRMIAIGLRPAEGDGEEEATPDSTPAEEGEAESEEEEAEGEAAAGDDEPELPALQIWHSGDVRVYPQQTASAAADARRTLLAVWHVDDERVVQVGTDLLANAELLEGWRYAVEDIAEPYGWGEMFGRPYHDVWAVDTRSGDRRQLLERVRYEYPSAGGGYIVTFDGTGYASVDVASGERRDLTGAVDATFANVDYDTPTDMLPPWSFVPVVWLEDDAGVLVYDEHDVWRLALDGSDAERLTRGAESGVTHRVARLGDDDTPGLSEDDPMYMSLHDDRTEQRGYARLDADDQVRQLIFEDKMINGLTKADSADVYAYRSMAFDDSPDLFVSGPDLSGAQVSNTNPFMSDFAWGRAELVDFVSESGRDLQAALFYPANYDGGAVPTIVYTYEILTPQMHFFRAPSERDYYNFTAWTQQGYAVLLPDIVYRARDPGISAVEAVRAAVATVVEMGVTDPDAVGLIGHSWGGYQATFLPTRTDIFAASVAGAPLTDFVSFMGQLHWNPGLPELSHWETGQARMEVPFWEDPEAHRRNSPIHEVHRMETPLLMAFGNEDGVVDWDQGTEFYNFARRAGKQMVLLVYEGEDHGFRQEPNQVDYHRRILEWFGHYLKGEPAPEWITDGIRLQDLEDEKKRVAKKRKAAAS